MQINEFVSTISPSGKVVSWLWQKSTLLGVLSVCTEDTNAIVGGPWLCWSHLLWLYHRWRDIHQRMNSFYKIKHYVLD